MEILAISGRSEGGFTNLWLGKINHRQLCVRFFIFALAFICLFASCRPNPHDPERNYRRDTRRSLGSCHPKPTEDSGFIIRENLSLALPFSESATRVSTKVDGTILAAMESRTNATVRMLKDSDLDLHHCLGIEGLRAFITRDSIKVLNKLDKIYIPAAV